MAKSEFSKNIYVTDNTWISSSIIKAVLSNLTPAKRLPDIHPYKGPYGPFGSAPLGPPAEWCVPT